MSLLRVATTASRRDRARIGLRWMVTFLGFPAGGLAAELIVGRVTDVPTALLGGLITGAILGAAQWWGIRPFGVRALPFALATATGLSVGLVVGAAAVDYGYALGDLVRQGAVCGLAVGLAQCAVLGRRLGVLAWFWPVGLAGIWSLGWSITTWIGVDVDAHYTVFGSSGAVAVTVLTVVLPFALRRSTRPAR